MSLSTSLEVLETIFFFLNNLLTSISFRCALLIQKKLEVLFQEVKNRLFIKNYRKNRLLAGFMLFIESRFANLTLSAAAALKNTSLVKMNHVIIGH